MPNDRQDATRGSRPARKIFWLGVAVVLAVILYTGAWFWAANRLESYLPALLARAESQGVRADCANPDIRGFPFRVGLFCDGTGLVLAEEGVTASAGALRSAAQVYNPRHVVSEIDGPLLVEGPNGLTARVDWRTMHASSILRRTGLERGSAEGEQISLSVDSPLLPVRFVADIGHLEAHLRQNGGDLDTVIEGRDFASPVALDAESFLLEATVTDAAAFLQAGGDPSLRGKTVRLHQMRSELAGGGVVALSGEISIDASGQADGDLRIRLTDPQAVTAKIAELQPDLADQIRRFTPVLAALDIEPDDGSDTVTLPLTIRDSEVSVGLLRLGQLPNL